MQSLAPTELCNLISTSEGQALSRKSPFRDSLDQNSTFLSIFFAYPTINSLFSYFLSSIYLVFFNLLQKFSSHNFLFFMCPCIHFINLLIASLGNFVFWVLACLGNWHYIQNQLLLSFLTFFYLCFRRKQRLLSNLSLQSLSRNHFHIMRFRF